MINMQVYDVITKNFLQIKRGLHMRQDQDVQYMLLSIRCLMHRDRMRTDAISESMIQVLYIIVVQCKSGVDGRVYVSTQTLVMSLYMLSFLIYNYS